MLITGRFLNPKYLVFLFTVLTLLACDGNEQNSKLTSIKILNDYPSGSGLAFLGNRLYVIGDDAADLLVMDTQFHATDSINIFSASQKRISKDIKADLESIALIKQNKAPAFLLPGSGSLPPYRNVCWIIDSAGKEKRQYALDTFYSRIKNEGIPDLNIEGVTTLPFGMMLASRGNKSFPKNYLILTPYRFWEKQESAGIDLIKVGANTDSSFFNGISGIDYSYITDQLFITVSTENTSNSYDDGAIGKSYLWIINDISSKRRWSAINPDRIIDLEELDNRFKGNKVESICIITDTKKQKELVLVADDDKGGTVLFKMIL